jgi:hypothetical protein
VGTSASAFSYGYFSSATENTEYAVPLLHAAEGFFEE